MKENIGLLKSSTDSNVEIETPNPQIQLNLGDSSININVIYQTDLRASRSTKHEIIKGILEEFEKTKDIEFAYPHLEIVSGGRAIGQRKFGKKLLEYVEQRQENSN